MSLNPNIIIATEIVRRKTRPKPFDNSLVVSRMLEYVLVAGVLIITDRGACPLITGPFLTRKYAHQIYSKGKYAVG